MQFLARVTPLPQAAPVTASVLDSCIKAFDVSIELTSDSPAVESSEEPSPASGSRLVGTAQRYSGVRYRWAGMSSRGMDCSGLIARVLRAHGIRAPHSAAQLFGLGRAVRFAELEPGDLLFFKTSRRGISHVGMYIGNGEFIHASSGAGRVVTTSVYDPYYVKRLKGARRLGDAPESGDAEFSLAGE
ncbi:MAG: C40 family peptidase [Armatimonadota bacterium]|nr:MAG: C40 family peptidase [Armatimonadota bacterium]